jgi:hypothetical protein
VRVDAKRPPVVAVAAPAKEHALRVESPRDRSQREHHKHQQSNRSVHQDGPAKPAAKPSDKPMVAKLRHKRRKRKVGA